MNHQSNRSDNLFLIGMILSMTCWGFSWTSGKILAMYGDPFTISFLRFSFTVLSLVFILVFLKEKFIISKKGYFDLMMAALLITVYTYLFFKGLVEGKAGAGGVLVTVLNPIFAYAITLIVQRRNPKRNESIGLLLGLVAGAVLLKIFSNFDAVFNAGNIYFLCAAVVWAGLSFFTARAGRYGSSMTFSFWLYTISSVLLLLISGFQKPMEVMMKGDFSFWGNLFFSATITTSLATTFYFLATAKVGAGKASSFIFMVPFSAALGSWMFLGEVIELHTILGGVLGIVAVYILNRREKKF